MIVFKRRLIFWLIRAYLRKWGKIIVFSFVGGLIIFFLLYSTSSFLLRYIPLEKKAVIGVAGNYTSDALPSFIVNKLSIGLTTIDDKGYVKPGLAKSWEIKDKGHTYVFHLNPNAKFSDGHQVSASDINYGFTDVKTDKPDSETVVYHLNEVYSPFLVTVSKPVLVKNFIGTGPYKLGSVTTNGTFLTSLTLVSVKDRLNSEKYVFYSTPDVLKMAFLLGEVTTTYNLSDTSYNNTDIAQYPNVTEEKETNYNTLVTLFINTQDDVLSDNKIRDALSYAVPNTFSQGERAYFPYPPQVWYYNNDLTLKTQDLTHAKLLIKASNSTVPTLIIKSLPKYLSTAQVLAQSFQAIGIKTKIEQVDGVPAKFQLYLGDFSLPRDPDQYALWHESQPNNITLLADKRIDKLLEDGRQTLDQNERKQIYDDFQEYLSDRAPAIFLYFPYNYIITRK